ncbi:YueI family protein [Mesobacillus maritimus]|uniref:YueI family protein n=1 Tax=Mesobacillus maritimus TaxID=1643336 RepID=A0ABS7K6K1_9BACI|nr:YueI family protein [Mesobacillus maritimus]
MGKQNLDDILQQGIHGAKQTKPDERRKFLGTIRERVVVALSKAEVRKKQIEPEFKQLLESNKGAQIYLNGNMNYTFYSKYIALADGMKVPYKIVTNKEHDSEYGLVLAYDYAIDKEDISLSKKPIVKIEEAPHEGTGFFTKVKTLFSKK